MSNSPNLPADYDVVQPSTVSDEDDSEFGSPVERMRKTLGESYYRDFIAADENNPLVETAGTREALLMKTPPEVQELLSEDLYQDEQVFFREWLQNHLAAVTREAKRRIRNEHGESALFFEELHKHPALDKPTLVRMPKPTHVILDEARDLGYQPRIEFIVDHDDGKLTTRDNGIGMTTGEAIKVWNRLTESGSGVDLSSAGNKGIGSLTWVTLAGKEAAMTVKTRTRRERSLSGETVPPRDREGYTFYSFFGGIIPIPGKPDDGFYGTEFEIPVQDSDPDKFYSWVQDYTEILPTMVSWVEIRDGERVEEELERQTFLDRYEREPAITVNEPGAYTVAMDKPDLIKKKRSTNDMFLLDNPIDRNLAIGQRFDTLWNEHIQIHNEQGLIIAGPNRGRRAEDVDELYGDISDITDEDAPTPDIPLPEPVASRDNLKRNEAHKRFFRYLEQVCTDAELETVSEFANGVLNADTVEDALHHVRSESSTSELVHKLLSKHGPRKISSNPEKLAGWLDSLDDTDFDLDDAPVVQPGEEFANGAVNETVNERVDRDAHPKWDRVQFLTALYQQVDVALKGIHGSPNKNDNRKTRRLDKVIGADQRWPIYVGASINEDRFRVLVHDANYPKAAVIKTNRYSEWTDGPFDAGLIKNVPFTRDEAEKCDEDWTVPDEIHLKRQRTTTTTRYVTDDGEEIDLTNPDNFQDRPIDVRCTENAAIDLTATIGDIMEALNETSPGDVISSGDIQLKQPYIVLFPDHTEWNISEHYDWSEYAAIIKCIKKEAEALLRYDQVYLPDEFEEMVSSTTVSVYDPFSKTGFNESLASVFNRGMGYVWLTHDSDVLWSAARGDAIKNVPTDHQHYDSVRAAILDKVVSDDAAANVSGTTDAFDSVGDIPESIRWRVVEYDPGIKHELFAYLGLFADGRPENIAPSIQYDAANRPTLSTGSLLSKQKVHRLDTSIKRAKHPQWDVDSKSWSRVNNDSYSGPTDFEKELLLACRDLGIDPANTENLRQAIVMLATTCPEGDS